MRGLKLNLTKPRKDLKNNSLREKERENRKEQKEKGENENLRRSQQQRDKDVQNDILYITRFCHEFFVGLMFFSDGASGFRTEKKIKWNEFLNYYFLL